MPTDTIEAARAWRAENVSSRLRVGSSPPSSPANQPARHASSPATTGSGAAGTTGATGDEEGASGTYSEFRTRREGAEAELAELRLFETKGELIRVAAVKTALGVAFATAREALLQLPSRLAPQLAGETDPATIQNLLYAEIHQVLVDLAGVSDRLGPEPAHE